MSNGSIACYGHAGSHNGPYYFGFGFAMDKARTTVRSHRFSFTIDVHVITKLANCGLI